MEATQKAQASFLDRIPTSGEESVLDKIRGSDELGAQFMKVTPSLAGQWLERNEHNRHMRSDRVERYGNMMEIDSWLPVADAIAFDVKGNLQNGQHRLSAVVRSGKPEIFLVAWNLPVESFKHTDVGLKRTPSDALEVEGFDDPIPMAAAVRLVVLWRRGELERCGSYKAVENYEVLGAAERCYPRIHEDVKHVRRAKTKLETLSIPRAMITFIKFVYEPTYQEKARQFVDQVMTGNNIPDLEGKKKASARLVLDKWEKVNNTAGMSMDRETKLAYLIQAANWHCTDNPHSRLRYREGDSFPTPEVDLPPEFE